LAQAILAQASPAVLSLQLSGCDHRRGRCMASDVYPLVFIVGLLVASSCSMPHLHSEAARARRHERAVRLGFVVPRAGGGSTRRIEVGAEVATRARTVAKSLELHRSHCRLLGQDLHSAAVAAVAARPVIGDGAFREARAAHKKANAAKHSWADLAAVPDSWEGLVPSPSSRGACSVACQIEIGDLSDFDIGLTGAGGSTCPSRSADAATQTDLEPLPSGLRACAPEFVPAEPVPLEVAPLVRNPWSELYDAQNSALALLCARLDECMPSQRRMRNVENSLDGLRKSMTSAIAERVDSQVARLRDAAPTENGFLTMDHFRDLILDLKFATQDRLTGALKVLAEKQAAAVESLSTARTEQIEAALGTLAVGPGPSAPCSQEGHAGRSDDGTFSVGNEILICNLAKSPQLNGLRATIISGLEAGRYGVQVADSNQSVRIRPECICLPPPAVPMSRGQRECPPASLGGDSNDDFNDLMGDDDWPPYDPEAYLSS